MSRTGIDGGAGMTMKESKAHETDVQSVNGVTVIMRPRFLDEAPGSVSTCESTTASDPAKRTTSEEKPAPMATPNQSDAPRNAVESSRPTVPYPQAAGPGQWTIHEEFPRQFGRYHLLERLGKGGMGRVYLAHDSVLNRRLAIKIPSCRDPDDMAAVLHRFNTEARTAASLHHPNICPIYDISEVDGVPFIAMAYIDGESLESLLKRIGQLPENQAADIVRKVALAVDEAHKVGVIHRDLKPSNIAINRRGEPIVLDFGLARDTAQQDMRMTPDGMMIGTPAYMPPEQADGRTESMGPPCDVYALGMILYELLTARLPFTGSIGTILHQIATTPPIAPARYRPSISLDLSAIAMKALQKRPEDRFASAAEFAAALEPFAHGAAPIDVKPSVVSAPSPTNPVLPSRPDPAVAPVVVDRSALRRLWFRRALVGLGALGILLGLVGVATGWYALPEAQKTEIVVVAAVLAPFVIGAFVVRRIF